MREQSLYRANLYCGVARSGPRVVEGAIRYRRTPSDIAYRPALSVGMTPEADTPSGGNAVYVFALPQ